MNLPNDCHDCPVWKKSLFRDLDPELINWISGKKQTICLKNKEVLFTQGQNVEGIFCHMTGITKVVQKDDAGNIRFSRFVLPGDTSGYRSLFIDTSYKGTAEVISENLQACCIPKEDVLHLLSHSSSFSKNLVVKISSELTRSEEEKLSVIEKTVRDRLALLLYELCDTDDELSDLNQTMIKADITKVDIANVLSVANETVIRLMSEMKSDGLISYQGKKIIINDLKKLKALSDR